MQDAWRAYLELAMGLTEAPRKKAQDVVRRVVGSGGTTAAQLQALGEELVSTGMANREALTKLVRFEVDRALGRVGLATAEEVAELTRRVQDLERQLREARSAGVGTSRTGAPAGGPPHAPAPVPAPESGDATAGGPPPPAGPVPSAESLSAPVAMSPAKKTVAKKAVAKKAVAKKAGPGKAVMRRSPGTVSPTGGDAEPAHPPKKAVRKQQPGGAE
ncbi:hypothetical protein [Micromonospora sp. NPDC023737]|uniref:phasin family protein n=1 Tax=unclassified Micromonospora TaxID=2617518 RepID=UPI0034048704